LRPEIRPTAGGFRDARDNCWNVAMDMIAFSTLAGAPLAVLLLSTPQAPQRDCVFTIHPQIETATFQGKEAQIVLPDRPTEYPCSYTKDRNGTVIAFTNQNGWRFVVRIGPKDAGTWSASKGAETVSGRAVAPLPD
jgi:hypothetical protein